MIFKDIHNECQRCANLKAWNMHMNGEHDYCCRCRPSGFISKDLHREPCEKFINKDCIDCINAGGDWECNYIHCLKGINNG